MYFQGTGRKTHVVQIKLLNSKTSLIQWLTFQGSEDHVWDFTATNQILDSLYLCVSGRTSPRLERSFLFEAFFRAVPSVRTPDICFLNFFKDQWRSLI